MRNTYGPDMVQRWVNGFTVSAMSMAMSLTSNTKEKIGQRNYLYYMNTSDEVMNENVMSQLDAELDHAGEETALSPQMLLLEQLRITPEKELSKMDFLLGEVLCKQSEQVRARYLSVKKAYPNEAEELFAEAQKMAQLRYKTYVRKTQENWED